jgi:hypothetical protein
MTKARIEPLRGQGRSVVHCGRCGQRLWFIQRDLLGGASELMEAHTYGWRYDAEHKTWRPTEKAANQYRAANDRILKGREEPTDHHAVTDAHVRRGRIAKRARMSLKWLQSEDRADALRLPTNIACVRCGEKNAVDVELHSA